MTYNGCRYQSYGEWSDTEVLWCFCDHSLCNVNISYIQYIFPGAASGQVQQGQSIRGQVRVSQGIGYWHRIVTGGSAGGQAVTQSLGQAQIPGQAGTIVRGQYLVQGQAVGGQSQAAGGLASTGWYGIGGGTRVAAPGPAVVDPLVYVVSSAAGGGISGGGRKDSLPAPVIIQRKPGQKSSSLYSVYMYEEFTNTVSRVTLLQSTAFDTCLGHTHVEHFRYDLRVKNPSTCENSAILLTSKAWIYA